MNILKYFLYTTSILVATQSAIAGNIQFNHNGVKTGSIVENCYHNPCSGAKILNFKKLSGSSESAMLELNILGYSKNWKSNKKKWNKKPHKLYITCSIESPTVTIDGQVTTLPINPDMALAGVLQTDYHFYVQACHGKYIDETKLAEKFGYNLQEY